MRPIDNSETRAGRRVDVCIEEGIHIQQLHRRLIRDCDVHADDGDADEGVETCTESIIEGSRDIGSRVLTLEA
jgi:hypothetical protein